ncbi:hypothetical protein CR513_03883, partial [Mucuna pruriens]
MTDFGDFCKEENLYPLHFVTLVKMHFPVIATQKPKSMSDEEWDFEHQQFKEGTFLSDHLNEFQGILD